MSGGISQQRAPHEGLKIVESLKPIAGTGSAQNGTFVSRAGFDSCIVPFSWATSGGVTGGTIVVKLQDALSGGGSPADYGDPQTINIPAGPNASGVLELAFDLKAARAEIRAVVDSDPTGGSPASIVSAPIILGGAKRTPV